MKILRVCSTTNTLPRVIAGGVAFFLVGCSAPEEVAESEPPPISFEGAMPLDYVGKWQTADKNSRMELSSDGTAKLQTIAPGRGESQVEGSWRVAEGNLLIRADNRVTKYQATLLKSSEKPAQLKLVQASTKLNVTYSFVK